MWESALRRARSGRSAGALHRRPLPGRRACPRRGRLIDGVVEPRFAASHANATPAFPWHSRGIRGGPPCRCGVGPLPGDLLQDRRPSGSGRAGFESFPGISAPRCCRDRFARAVRGAEQVPGIVRRCQGPFTLLGLRLQGLPPRPALNRAVVRPVLSAPIHLRSSSTGASGMRPRCRMKQPCWRCARLLRSSVQPRALQECGRDVRIELPGEPVSGVGGVDHRARHVAIAYLL